MCKIKTVDEEKKELRREISKKRTEFINDSRKSIFDSAICHKIINTPNREYDYVRTVLR